MYLNIGNGEKHSRWSVVSPCTYSFELNYELINNILNKKLESNKLKLTNTNLKELVNDEYPNIQEFIENRYNDIGKFKLNKELIDIVKRHTFPWEKKDLENINISDINLYQNIDRLINIFNKCDNQRYFIEKNMII